jgi:hypothetical protein
MTIHTLHNCENNYEGNNLSKSTYINHRAAIFSSTYLQLYNKLHVLTIILEHFYMVNYVK